MCWTTQVAGFVTPIFFIITMIVVIIIIIIVVFFSWLNLWNDMWCDLLFVDCQDVYFLCRPASFARQNKGLEQPQRFPNFCDLLSAVAAAQLSKSHQCQIKHNNSLFLTAHLGGNSSGRGRMERWIERQPQSERKLGSLPASLAFDFYKYLMICLSTDIRLTSPHLHASLAVWLPTCQSIVKFELRFDYCYHPSHCWI